MEPPLPPGETSQRSPSCSSSAFQSTVQSPWLLESATPDTSPDPLPARSGRTHLPVSPPEGSLCSPLSLRASGERVPGGPSLDRGGRDGDASDASSLGYRSGCERHGHWESGSEQDLDPLSPFARVKSCDVYLGFSGQRPALLRFVKWLRAELEMQGVSCFVSDLRRGADPYAHSIARAAMDAATYGVVVVTRRTFSNPYSMEELRVFLEKRRLVPIFFELSREDCIARDIVERRGELWERDGGELWTAYGGTEREWKVVVDKLSRTELKLEVNLGNFRDRIVDLVLLLGMGLGRTTVVDKVKRWKELAVEEFPFPRNASFIGRRREMLELELLLFGDIEGDGDGGFLELRTNSRHRRDAVVARGDRSHSGATRERVAKQYEERKQKGKEPVIWKESEENIEMQRRWSGERPVCFVTERGERKRNAADLSYGKGIACVSGDSGIGKTELLLEYAYRFSQRYKMILWVGGEAKYLWQNYMRLLPLLGVDVSTESELCPERNGPTSFRDIQKEAISKVRKELMRDIPFLLVIDNLESEKDWWDGMSIMDLLPPFGRETHVLISTRLPQVFNIEPLKLLYLSGAEGMSLMKGSSKDLKPEDADALRAIEEKLGRLPFGLALVGSMLSELPIDPRKLLDLINKMPYRELPWSQKEDLVLKRNPFLIQLLDLCFSILDNAGKANKLAMKMVCASSWFAPAPIPIPMLALSARETPGERHGTRFWRECLRMVSCTCMKSRSDSLEAEALSLLLRLRIARSSTKIGCISFHDIFKLYACKRGSGGDASSMIRAVSIGGSVLQHFEHIWAACFLLFKFGNDPAVVNLPVRDLLSFIRLFVLPLASQSFTKFSQCIAVLELLRLSTEALESLEDSFLSEGNTAQSKSSCLMSPKNQLSIHSDPSVYKDLAKLRATLLERRAKLMLKGGQYDISEQLCRTAVSIKEVIYGWEHPETQATRETMERSIRFQADF